MSFSGKVVLVTGASSGIGAAAAVLFAKQGACVALVGRNEAKLANVAQQCGQHGPQPLVIKADVADERQASTIVQQTIEKFGKLDVLINNAGISRQGSLLEGNILEAYDVVMQTNVRAVIHLTTIAVPHLIKTKGNIINTGSTAALHVPKLLTLTSYCVSKAALDHFTRCAALELAPHGVRVNSVNPGPVKTDILENCGWQNADAIWENYKKSTALNRIGEPEEIAELMLFLASDKAKSITGSICLSDNGYLLKH
ncbi:3-oxoacyl-[acyl-carrier-protein] reductase FabG-like [Cydia pomonella]|uniref:3-oxoacyl-[acyl-carrier-protein] reductase FabG-like n=1 Tax=Cydia pomonella TaxID=82600 RepID=UPI002ADE1C4C|nr:3-oxoacyl-[acyl-carrier-protein] reductase FabG-like [Cydia pomonella]